METPSKQQSTFESATTDMRRYDPNREKRMNATSLRFAYEKWRGYNKLVIRNGRFIIQRQVRNPLNRSMKFFHRKYFR